MNWFAKAIRWCFGKPVRDANGKRIRVGGFVMPVGGGDRYEAIDIACGKDRITVKVTTPSGVTFHIKADECEWVTR